MTNTQKEKLNYKDIKWGDILRVDLGQNIGSEQSGVRPVFVISNDTGNHFSPSIIVCSITASQSKLSKQLPVHILISSDEDNGLEKNSVILLEQVRTIDKIRIKDKLGHCSPNIAQEVWQRLMISFAKSST